MNDSIRRDKRGYASLTDALRAMASNEHSDHSIAGDAADEIERLQRELAEKTDRLNAALIRLKGLHGLRLEGEPKPIDNSRFFKEQKSEAPQEGRTGRAVESAVTDSGPADASPQAETVLAKHSGNTDRREWHSVGTWLYPGEEIVERDSPRTNGAQAGSGRGADDAAVQAISLEARREADTGSRTSAALPSSVRDRNAVIEECAKVAENCLFTDIAANRIRALKAAPQGFPPASQSPVSAGDAGLSPAGAAPTVKECLPVAEAVLPQDVEDAISGCVSYYGDKYGIGLPLQNDLRSLADLTMRWANGTRGTGDPADASPHAELPSSEKDRLEKDEAYRQRNVLVAALARLYPSGVRKTNIEGWSEDWHGCVYIDLPTGQISYHYHDSQTHLFAGLPAYEKTWDGHDKETVERRLLNLASATQRRKD